MKGDSLAKFAASMGAEATRLTQLVGVDENRYLTFGDYVAMMEAARSSAMMKARMAEDFIVSEAMRRDQPLEVDARRVHDMRDRTRAYEADAVKPGEYFQAIAACISIPWVEIRVMQPMSMVPAPLAMASRDERYRLALGFERIACREAWRLRRNDLLQEIDCGRYHWQPLTFFQPFSNTLDERGFLAVVHATYCGALLHEADELFLYGGQRILDPHCTSRHLIPRMRPVEFLGNDNCRFG